MIKKQIFILLSILAIGISRKEVEVEALIDARQIGRGEYQENHLLKRPQSRAPRKKPPRLRPNKRPVRTENIACVASRRAACPAHMYCQPDGDSCSSSAKGHCEVKSARCTREFRPVCGCDHNTWPNICVARHGQAMKGYQVGILSYGKC